MKEKVVYALVIDRSSSMADLRDEIFQSINARIAGIKELAAASENTTLAEIVTFNNKVERVIALSDATKLKLLDNKDYHVEGTTALYDALGSTLERLNLLYREEAEKGACRIVVVVYTDGYENASRLYSKGVIQEMLHQANKIENIDITLVGCDEQTLLMAQELNFKTNNVVRTSKNTLAKSMSTLDKYFSAIHRNEKPDFKADFNNFDLDKD